MMKRSVLLALSLGLVLTNVAYAVDREQEWERRREEIQRRKAERGEPDPFDSIIKNMDVEALKKALEAGADSNASVVFQSDDTLFKTALARLTLARISFTLAVQTNDLGLSLCPAI